MRYPTATHQRLHGRRDGLPGRSDPRRLLRLRPDQLRRLRAGHDHARPRDVRSSGLRFDYNKDEAGASQHRRQPARRPVAARRSTSSGADPGVAFNDLSPRVGFTYDLTRQRPHARAGRTTRATTARSATAASPPPSTRSRATTLRYPWTDAEQQRLRRRRTRSRSAPNPIAASTQLVGGQSRQHRRRRTRSTRT